MASVLIINEVPVFGGVNTVVRSLWQRLPALGLPCRLLIPCQAGPDTERFIDEWFQGARDRVHTLPLRFQGRSLRRTLRNIPIFRRFEESIFNIHFNALEGVSLPLILAAKLAGKKVVVTLHHLGPESDMPAKRRWAVSRGLTWADRVTCSTPIMRDRVMKIAPKAKVEVIPLGVAKPKRMYDRMASRERFGVPRDAFVVGHFSRLVIGKGLPRVIAAMEQLGDRIPNQYLLAMGSKGEDEALLRDMLAERMPGRSQLLGHVADIHEALSCCDLLAVPSGWEGFGLVYVEAAMVGIPRIGTDMGGVSFVIRDGVDGFLIPFDDARALCDRICLIHDDPGLRQDMGAAAQAHAMSEFAEERMGDRYFSVMSRLEPVAKAQARLPMVTQA